MISRIVKHVGEAADYTTPTLSSLSLGVYYSNSSGSSHPEFKAFKVSTLVYLMVVRIGYVDSTQVLYKVVRMSDLIFAGL